MSAIRALWLFDTQALQEGGFLCAIMSQKLLSNNIKLDDYSDSSNTLFFCCIFKEIVVLDMILENAFIPNSRIWGIWITKFIDGIL